MDFTIGWGGVASSVHRALTGLLFSFGKAECMYKDGAMIINTLYAVKDQFVLNFSIFATNKAMQRDARVTRNMRAIVIPLFGYANCEMVGFGPLDLKPPQFYFVNVPTDKHRCRFPVGVSGFLYVFLHEAILKELKEAFPGSEALDELMNGPKPGEQHPEKYDRRIVNDQMVRILLLLKRARTAKSYQRDSTLHLTRQLIWAAFEQAESKKENTPIPTPATIFQEEHEKAEKDFLLAPFRNGPVRPPRKQFLFCKMIKSVVKGWATVVNFHRRLTSR